MKHCISINRALLSDLGFNTVVDNNFVHFEPNEHLPTIEFDGDERFHIESLAGSRGIHRDDVYNAIANLCLQNALYAALTDAKE